MGSFCFFIRIMKSSQMSLYKLTFFQHQNNDGSEMLDSATLVILGTGSSSLFVAFIEYLYSRRKRKD